MAQPRPPSPPSFSLFPSILTKRVTFHQTLISLITFLAYASLHASRKPPSIVKSVLGPEIPRNGSNPLHDLAPPQMGWAPFNGTQGTHRLGELDLAFLSSYAFGMFFSGHFADKTDLRLFLSSGMLLSGVLTIGFGCGYWLKIHNLWYYVVVQMLSGLFQSTGWPCVVSVVGNWFKKSSKRGLIMGLWNSHTSIGNILGSIVASCVLKYGWGWSFFWPGLIVIVIGLVVYCFLAVSPHVEGLSLGEVELNGGRKDSAVVVPENAAETEHASLLEGERPETADGSHGVGGKDAGSVDAIGFLAALRLPGVAPFAACLFFSKLVAYTFLYWLPFYIRHTAVAGVHLSHETAGLLSTVFDVGGVVGGAMAGLISDKLGARAVTSVVFLVLSMPALLLYRLYGSISMFSNIMLMSLSGLLVNGPYALITTAVAADLGTQSAIKGNSRALATVTAIIDGTGSIGAAIGPVLVGYISTSSWNTVFGVLIGAIFTAALFLFPAVITEVRKLRTEHQTGGTVH